MAKPTDIRVKWYVTDKEPLFKSQEDSDTLVLEADGIGVFEGGCTVSLHIDQECRISEVTKRVETLMQAVRDGVKRGKPWRGSGACFYGVINGDLMGIAYAVDDLKPLFQEHEYDYLQEEECAKLGVPSSVAVESVTLEEAHYHTGNSGVTLGFEVDDYNEHRLRIRLSAQGNSMVTTIPIGSMEMMGWLHEATGRLLDAMAKSRNEGRTFPFEYHPQGEICVHNGKKVEQYFSWDAKGRHLLKRQPVSADGPGWAVSSHEFTEVKTPCCDHDHDGDGNCDRHPGSEAPAR